MDKKLEEMQSEIESLRAEVAEQRKTIMRQKAVIEDFKTKEQSISSAIIASMEHANQLEASRKKLYSLDIQRSRLMYLRMQQIIDELYLRYPEISKDTKLRDMSDKFKTMVYKDLSEKTQDNLSPDMRRQTVVDDPIKKLLHNIIDCFDTKKGNVDFRSEPNDDLINNNVSSSGFDFNEALHPTMELDEILKAFNLGKNNK